MCKLCAVSCVCLRLVRPSVLSPCDCTSFFFVTEPHHSVTNIGEGQESQSRKRNRRRWTRGRGGKARERRGGERKEGKAREWEKVGGRMRKSIYFLNFLIDKLRMLNQKRKRNLLVTQTILTMAAYMRLYIVLLSAAHLIFQCHCWSGQ